MATFAAAFDSTSIRQSIKYDAGPSRTRALVTSSFTTTNYGGRKGDWVLLENPKDRSREEYLNVPKIGIFQKNNLLKE